MSSGTWVKQRRGFRGTLFCTAARCLTAGALTAMAFTSWPASAQTAGAPTLSGSQTPAPHKDAATADKGVTQPDKVEQVVVTARFRKEKLQNVPLAIVSLSAQTLKAANATSLQDITFLTPGLTFTSNGQEANEAPTIRGLSDTSGGEATSSNVSIFLDRVYVANPSAIDLSLNGLDNVEIDKGPVSGLYGRNAFTGAINYTTAKPSQEFHTDEAFTVGNDGRYITDAEITGPIIPGILAGRISGRYSHLDGTFTDPVSHQDGNGYDRKDVLASLLFTPDEHISIEGVGYYGYDVFNAPVDVIYKQNCAFGTSNSYCGSLNNNQLGPNIPSSGGAGTTGLTRKVEHFHVDNKATYSFGTFDVLVGFNKISTTSLNDFTGTENGLPYYLYPVGKNSVFTGDLPNGGPIPLKSFFGDEATESDSSVEARYDTPANLPVRLGVGGYWYYHVSTNENLFGIDSNTVPAGETLNAVAANYLSPYGKPVAPLNFAEQATRDYSGVVTGEWDIIPTLTLSTAVRDTEELEKTHGKTGPLSEADFHELTSNEALTWKPTSRYTFYVSAANGAKSGGFNGAALGPADATFQPETDWDYEGGVKTTLLQSHLLINADVFHTEVSNLQVLGPPSTPGAIGLVVKNFGEVDETGFEVSGNWVVGNGIKLFSGIEYAEPRFGSGAIDFNDGAACALIASCASSRLVTVKGNKGVNLNGLAPPFSSDLTFNFNAEYSHPTGFWDNIDYFLRGDYRFESRQYNTVTNFAYYGPRNVLNLHAGLQNGTWTFSGNVLNVTNDLTPVTNQFDGSLNNFDAPPNGTFGVFWQPTSVLPEGRTFFFKLAYHY